MPWRRQFTPTSNLAKAGGSIELEAYGDDAAHRRYRYHHGIRKSRAHRRRPRAGRIAHAFDRLADLLALHGWNAREVDCYAAAAGPGSFTSVRVGLAAAKGLAEAATRPLIGVSNLKAVAWFGTAPLRAAVLDARRGEIYGAVFDHALEPVREEVVAKFPEWIGTLPDGALEFLSPDPAHFQDALAATRFAEVPVTATPRAVAGAIGMIAHKMFLDGCAPDPAAADAQYVRRSDAELFWKEA